MKKIVIGRAKDCDVIIEDKSDLVSRHHAIIAFNFWGKMTLCDTSKNGTFVNGERITQKVVKKSDDVSLGQVWSLDWKTIKDPYRFIKLGIVIGILVAVIAICAIIFWLSKPKPSSEPTLDKSQPTLVDSAVQKKVQEDEVIQRSTQENGGVSKSKRKKSQQKSSSRRAVKNSYSNAADSAAEYEPEPSPRRHSSNQQKAVPIIY